MPDERESELLAAAKGMLFDTEDGFLSEFSHMGMHSRIHACRGCWEQAPEYQKVNHAPDCPIGRLEKAVAAYEEPEPRVLRDEHLPSLTDEQIRYIHSIWSHCYATAVCEFIEAPAIKRLIGTHRLEEIMKALRELPKGAGDER